MRISFILLVAIISCLSNGCEFGDFEETTSNIINMYDTKTSGTRVYLDLENPASCGGYVKNITICFLTPRTNEKVTDGTLSLWEPMENTSNSYIYKEVSNSEVDIPLIATNSCGLNSEITLLPSDNNENAAKQIVCQYYCDINILVKFGTVLGITYTENLNYNRGQMLVENNLQTYGLCDATVRQLELGFPSEVSCPKIAENTSITLLAGAGIEPITCPPLSLKYGTVTPSPPYSYGSVVNFTCQTGFTLSGPTSTTCGVDSQWSNLLPVCDVLNCTDPGTPINGNRELNDFNFKNGSIVNFTCNEGYTLIGSNIIMCYRGNYTFPVPLCNVTTGGGDTDNQAAQYQFLTAILVVVIFVIVILVMAVFVLMFVYKRFIYTPLSKNENVNNQLSPSVTFSTLKRPLLDEDDAAIQISDEVYDEIRDPGSRPPLPIPRPLTVVSSSLMSSPHQYSASPQPPSRATLSFNRGTSPFPSTIVIENPSTATGEAEEGGALSPSVVSFNDIPLSQHYEMSNELGGLVEEDEDNDDDAYWEPAMIEEKLYLQLDSIRVRRIHKDEINITEELGSGQFASVHKGTWRRPQEGDLQVAVKVLSSQDENDKIRFLQEAALMGQFTHTNVISLYGVVTNDLNTTMIVTELMEGGDLRHWLLKRKEEVPLMIKPEILLNFCRQICLGLSYLSSRKFVHRDLAARNVLVTGDNICKISDFGMSHDLLDENYYMAREGTLIPVKWTAPEALKYRKYSTASDVWSYGCVLYEIWSLGCKPFEGVTNNETIRKISSGYRLPPPPGCPRLLYEIMIKCWHPINKKRPSFNDIMLQLLIEDKLLLEIPSTKLVVQDEGEENESQSTNSAPLSQSNNYILGADLVNGESMYKDLQLLYVAPSKNTI